MMEAHCAGRGGNTMGFVANSEVVEVELVNAIAGQVVEMTLYFLLTGTIDEAALLSLGASVGTWFVTNVLPHLSDGVVYMHAKSTSLASVTSPSVISTNGTGTAGGDSNAMLPTNVAATIKFGTAERGKSARGRNYIFGLTGIDVVDNVLQTGFRSAMLTAYALLPAAVTGDGATHVVYSRRHDKADRTTGRPLAVTDYSFADVNSDAQRRRLTGRGR